MPLKHNYWRLIFLSWMTVIVLVFPALTMTWGTDGMGPLMWVGAIPLLAHGYAFIAAIPALRECRDQVRIGAALPVLSYPLGCIACLPFMPLEMALGMPYAGIFMGILTFGIFFTGLAPLLAIALTRVVMAPELNRRRIAVSLMMLTVGWMLSGITGYLLGNA